jgi:hypothetical protein
MQLSNSPELTALGAALAVFGAMLPARTSQLLFIGFILFAGCRSEPTTSGTDGEIVTPPPILPPDTGMTDSLGSATPPSTGEQPGCSDAAKLVYVLSDANGLYTFAPDKKSFTKIGEIACGTTAAPNSMAVDRSGTAWVNFTDGKLFKVDTKDAKCHPTAFVGPPDFQRFGMAFASDTAGAVQETLYVAGLDSVSEEDFVNPGLAKIDLATMALTRLGRFSGGARSAHGELTGTGDGRLFGFFITDPPFLAEVNKASGETKESKPLNRIGNASAFAFSFWGGDFWFYVSSGSGAPSRVTQLKSGTGETSNVIANVGFRIAGAGVSTCAPTVPPR